jgi:hypothetical protein
MNILTIDTEFYNSLTIEDFMAESPDTGLSVEAFSENVKKIDLDEIASFSRDFVEKFTNDVLNFKLNVFLENVIDSNGVKYKKVSFVPTMFFVIDDATYVSNGMFTTNFEEGVVTATRMAKAVCERGI